MRVVGPIPAHSRQMDFYPTLRVKASFQRMNLEGIRDRLQTVGKRIQDLEGVLRANLTLDIDTKDEDLRLFVPVDEGPKDDPNSLCVPRRTLVLVEGGGLVVCVISPVMPEWPLPEDYQLFP